MDFISCFFKNYDTIDILYTVFKNICFMVSATGYFEGFKIR